jgi:hypothetical protein
MISFEIRVKICRGKIKLEYKIKIYYAMFNICLLYAAIKFICWNNNSDLSTNGSVEAATVVVI